MTKISRATIEPLNPCKSRFDNFLKFYGDKEFTPRQFMGLKNITHSDKLWVAFRVLPKELVVKAAADIAESVLHIYESQHPNDDRPRKAIEAARSGVNTTNSAYYATSTSAAYYAANAANAAYDKTKFEKQIRTTILKYWK